MIPALKKATPAHHNLTFQWEMTQRLQPRCDGNALAHPNDSGRPIGIAKIFPQKKVPTDVDGSKELKGSK
jgi:hypothetical protein